MAEHRDNPSLFDDDDSHEHESPKSEGAQPRPDRPTPKSSDGSAPREPRPANPSDGSGKKGASWRDHGTRPASPKPLEGTGDIGRGRGRVTNGPHPDQPTQRSAPITPKPGAPAGTGAGTHAATHANPDEVLRSGKGSSRSRSAGSKKRPTSTDAIRQKARESQPPAEGTGFPGAGDRAGEKVQPHQHGQTPPGRQTRVTSRTAAAGAAASSSSSGSSADSTMTEVPAVARPQRSPVSYEGAAITSRQPRERSVIPALITAVILSVLLHAAVVSAVFNRPIGRVDPHSLQPPHRINLTRRVEQDIFTTADERGPGEQPADQQLDEPQLDDISRQLLEQPIEQAELPQEQQPDELEKQLRDVNDQRAEIAEVAEASDDPFDLPGEIMSSMLVGPAVNLPETADAGNAAQAGSGATAGDGASDLASRMIADLGGNPLRGGISGGAGSGSSGGGITGGGGLRMPDLPEPKHDQPLTNVTDQRLVDAPADLPELDLLESALASTTQLNVPLNLDNDFDYTVHTWWGGNRPDGPPGYFRVDITPKQSLRKLKTIPKDVVVIIDTSGSVSSRWMREIVQGVGDGLASLNEGDRFNIVLFNENPSFLNPDGLEPFNQRSLAEAQQFLRGAKPRGYTDVNRALSQLLVRDVNAERVHNLILISDGVPTKGVMDTRELINLITRDNNLVASIYCVGVGDEQNTQLMEFLAYRNKGFCEFVENRSQTAPELRNLFSRLRYPIVQNITLSLAGVEASRVYPKHLPNIHQGERLSIYGRFAKPEEFTMRLTGANGAQPVDFTFTRDLVKSEPAGPTIARDWAFWKLHHLYSEIIRQGASDALLREIREIRQVYDLKTLY